MKGRLIDFENLGKIAGRFSSAGISEILEHGNGNINDTFLVKPGRGEDPFILQRVNTRVFHRPDLIMRNMRIVTEHIRGRITGGERWEVPAVLLTRAGEDHFRDTDGSFWRATGFIDGAESFDIIRDGGHAGQVGYAFGRFHRLLGDLPGEVLADTLEGFHITPGYLLHYDRVREKKVPVKSPETDFCFKFISERRAWSHVLENAKKKGILPLRPIHGDAKANNVLIDSATGRAVSIIDLDTVKPGLVHYDIGDCIRSGCNPSGEETEQWEGVRLDPDLCRAVLRGYFPGAGFLSGQEFEYIYDAIRLIAFELGLRFFTDYLEGNVYFKVGKEGHNLLRALVQFRLTESIESYEADLRKIIGDLAR